jgi:hypothetical protein
MKGGKIMTTEQITNIVPDIITVYGLTKIHKDLVESITDEGTTLLLTIKFNDTLMKIRILKDNPNIGVRIDNHADEVTL